MVDLDLSIRFTSASSFDAEVVRAIVMSTGLKIDKEVRPGWRAMVQQSCLWPVMRSLSGVFCLLALRLDTEKELT